MMGDKQLQLATACLEPPRVWLLKEGSLFPGKRIIWSHLHIAILQQQNNKVRPSLQPPTLGFRLHYHIVTQKHITLLCPVRSGITHHHCLPHAPVSSSGDGPKWICFVPLYHHCVLHISDKSWQSCKYPSLKLLCKSPDHNWANLMWPQLKVEQKVVRLESILLTLNKKAIKHKSLCVRQLPLQVKVD